jgi:hypothetical protein
MDHLGVSTETFRADGGMAASVGSTGRTRVFGGLKMSTVSRALRLDHEGGGITFTGGRVRGSMPNWTASLHVKVMPPATGEQFVFHGSADWCLPVGAGVYETAGASRSAKEMVEFAVVMARQVPLRFGVVGLASGGMAWSPNWFHLDPTAWVSGYGWAQLVTSMARERIDWGALEESGGSEVALDGASKGSVLLVAPRCPALMSLDELRLWRQVFVGAWPPTRVSAHNGIVSRQPIRPGIVPEDWVLIDEPGDTDLGGGQ